jgi:LemA protein
MTFSSNQKPYLPRSAALDPGLQQFVLLLVVGAAVLGLSLASCTHDVIPTLEQTAKTEWTNVQNQYQGRLDLVPKLSAMAASHMKQEDEALTAVAEARDRAISASIDARQLTDPAKLQQFEDAQAHLAAALSRLLSVSEKDPDLKSNGKFLALQSQLEAAEKRITVARPGYIEASRRYNLALDTFPTLLWADGKHPLAEFTIRPEGEPLL